ncbi:MAG: flagellar biosynthesis anti-sigma factor FlgM [Oscillibacter sp.]|nr:flagellar biosynthesis anti-sigma factor FlgM [Oscillibacter sp.]
MTISGTLTTNFSKPVELQRAYPNSQTPSAQSQKPSLTRRFDSVTISGENGRPFAMEARSRLAREVRTATSSGSVAAIREEIRQGTYRPDSMEIARNMLLFGEGG